MADRWGRVSGGVVEAGWLACLAGVPLFLSPVVALMFTADKVPLFRVLVELTTLAAALLWLRRPGFRPAPLTAALALYGLAVGLSTLLGRNTSQSFWGSYFRLFGLFTLLHGGALYGAVAAYFRTERQWQRLLTGVATASVLICVHALVQWRGLESRLLPVLLGRPDFHWSGPASETYRPFATLGNSSFLGAFLVFALAFALGALVSSRRRWPAAALVALVIVVLAVNQTRGAWLGAAAVGFTFAWLCLPRERRRALVMVGGGVLSLLLAVGLVAARNPNAAWVASNPICTRMAHFLQHDRNSSGWYRLEMWRRLGGDLTASPAALLLGYGPESYLLVSSHSFVPSYADGAEGAQFMDSTHNIFADALVDGGVLGLLALVAVLVLAFHMAVRGLRDASSTRRSVLITALAALVGYVIQGIFLFDHVVTLIYLAVTLGLIAAASRREWGRQLRQPHTHPLSAAVSLPGFRGLWLASTAGAMLILASLVLLRVNLDACRAQMLKRQAEVLMATGQSPAAVGLLREACRLVPYERTYHVALATSLAAGVSPDRSRPDEMRAAFRAAERELRLAIAIDPGDVRTYWPLGLLYQFWGPLDATKFAAGEEVYRHAAALSPRRQRTYWAWGDLLLAQGRSEEALGLYRRALALDPTVAAAQRALASLYVRLGQPGQAEPLYVRAWRSPAVTLGTVVPPSQQAAEREALGLAFLARGRPERARLYLTQALSLDAERPRARAALERLSRRQASSGPSGRPAKAAG
jgi:tetratricopeptide (TPR) repeat protein